MLTQRRLATAGSAGSRRRCTRIEWLRDDQRPAGDRDAVCVAQAVDPGDDRRPCLLLPVVTEADRGVLHTNTGALGPACRGDAGAVPARAGTDDAAANPIIPTAIAKRQSTRNAPPRLDDMVVLDLQWLYGRDAAADFSASSSTDEQPRRPDN